MTAWWWGVRAAERTRDGRKPLAWVMIARRIVIAWLALLAMAMATAAPARTIALTNLHLIDGLGGAPVDGATIVITDSVIMSAGRGVVIPRNARKFDYRGRWVMPGLVSNHSHVGQVHGVTNGGANYTRTNITAELVQFRRFGVTTVLALGFNGPLFNAIRLDAHASRLGGADLFGAIKGISVPNGGPPQMIVNLLPNQLLRPANAEEARAAVRQLAAEKTDLVKIWLDDFKGFAPVKMSPDIYRAVIDESHKHGLRVAAHTHSLEDAEAVVAAGVDILAHGVQDVELPSAFVSMLKAKGVWYVPTLGVNDASLGWIDQAPWTRTPFARTALSPAFARQVDDPLWREQARRGPIAKGAREALAFNMRNLKIAHDAGLRIGFGSDSGSMPMRVPGLAEHRELVLMVQAGLSPAEALHIATSQAAALMELHDRGAIAPGKRADLVVLTADPTIDISNTDKIVEVWVAGHKHASNLPQ